MIFLGCSRALRQTTRRLFTISSLLHMMKTDLEIGFGDVFREQSK